MGKLYYLIGKSASGKDSFREALLQDAYLSLNEIVQCTTRPIRAGEQDGREYHFLTDAQVDELNAAGKIVELRAYNTIYGVWKYMLADTGHIDLENKDYVAVGTVESYQKVRDYFGEARVVPIYIYVEAGERLARALNRERAQSQPKYKELCRRFLADEEDFDDAHLQEAGLLNADGNVRNCFENLDFQECLENVKRFITHDRESAK